MGLSTLGELLKDAGLTVRDHRKLLAHTWWISDEKTNFSKQDKYHPWVCLDENHPDNFSKYTACPRSTKKPKNQSEKFSIFTEAKILPKLKEPGYILIYCARPFEERVIDSGEHIGDWPEEIKEKIRQKKKLWRERRPAERWN